MNPEVQKLAIAGTVLIFAMTCCGVSGSFMTWMVFGGVAQVGAAGGGSGGYSGGSSGGRGPIELTHPEYNPPKPVPLIRPGSVSAPPMVDPMFTSSQCDDIPNGGAMHGPDCATAEISCDQQLIGHTLGGVELYDSVFYEKKFCWPRTIDHDSGDERVYRLKMPAGEWRAWVTLHSPCADLDVFAIRWDEETCPTMGSNINQCEAKPVKGTGTERIELTSQTFDGAEPSWWVVVEGRNQDEGPFSLHVQCARGLGGALP